MRKDNLRSRLLVALPVALATGMIVVMATGCEKRPSSRPPRVSPPPRVSRCPKGLCDNDPVSHVHMNWTNESGSFWTVTVEHHSGKRDSTRIPPGEGRQIDGILAGSREVIVERETGERWVGMCEAHPGFNHSMKITNDDIRMLMKGMWMKCGWLHR